MPEHKDDEIKKNDEIKSDDQQEPESSDEEEEGERSSSSSSGQETEPQIASVKEKIGEGRGNLHRRSEWYQRRTGGSDET
ncbi:MAG: hypothetical protein QOC61_37 [Acidobacteriota bacterium]|jgi:hypothetical protein|nr:hypothetical protein [Acidobacteriota bacterium]MDT5261033.1 hypothetical protein [Acidobacteriota bacterium]